MGRTSVDNVVPDYRDETLMSGGEELMVEEMQLEKIVQQNQQSTNTKLFSFLALLNTYVPESYLLMSECQKILGPPDPIHGGPPFEQRMKPFIGFINTSSSDGGRVCMISPTIAETALKALANVGISRSKTMKNFMASLCGDEMQPHIFQFIKALLTKREFTEKGKDKFSRLIEDIQKQEQFQHALSVLKMASSKFQWYHIFPQTISRLCYLRKDVIYLNSAEKWAKEAIGRAQNNSYVADTLGQVYKRHLIKAKQLRDIKDGAMVAFEAFKDVEVKADNEEGLEMQDTAGTLNISSSFNNRGLFGFIQVAKIAYEKFRYYPPQKYDNIFPNLRMEVEAKFDFFEWYLTFSKPGMTSIEPDFFWKDVVLCYEYYTTQTAAESTSFAGLLDSLNYGLFTSKGKRAGFEDAEQGGRTVADLEAIRDYLETSYKANPDDDKAAERYILSNIILSNKNSLQVTPVNELQTILYTFLDTGHTSPEFYLLVLLLFWPEEQPQVVQEEDDEEVEQLDRMDSDEEQETRREPIHLSPNLQEQVTFMETAFERAGYAKYLRGRYLLPLFFLGKGSGLSRWIHKSRLDAIVEKKVDAELGAQKDINKKKKLKQINEMWVKGGVWQDPEIQDILLPVQVELCPSPTMPQQYEKRRVFVCVEGKKIMATTEVELYASAKPFYLGFTIRGPVVFKVGP